MIVVDASAVVNIVGDDLAWGHAARTRVVGEQLAAPHLVDIEVGAALRRMRVQGFIGEQRCTRALSDLAALRIQRADHRPLLPRCWELRHNMTFYDAAYVALAELLDAPLLTADARLATAPGIRCTVELLSAA